MKVVDMRTLSPAARFALRAEVVRMRQAGSTYDQIAAQLGLSRTGVFDICKRHEASGESGLHDRLSGRRVGAGRLLDSSREAVLCRLISDHTPDELAMQSPLWTREAVQRLVQKRFGVRIPIRTLGTYLSRWGFIPRKVLRPGSPLARAWPTLDYPALVARARIEDGEIQWLHTERLRPGADAMAASSSAPEPVALIVRKEAPSSSVASAVSNRGLVRWKVYADTLAANDLIDFLRRLVRATARKIFLVAQEMPVTRDESVQEWLDEHVDEIEVLGQPDDAFAGRQALLVRAGEPA
jgi:transposase